MPVYACSYGWVEPSIFEPLLQLFLLPLWPLLQRFLEPEFVWTLRWHPWIDASADPFLIAAIVLLLWLRAGAPWPRLSRGPRAPYLLQRPGGRRADRGEWGVARTRHRAGDAAALGAPR